MAAYTVSELKILSKLAAKYGAERVSLRSYARGEAKPESDIDLRIDKGSIRGLALPLYW